jgi:hypothetical protein
MKNTDKIFKVMRETGHYTLKRICLLAKKEGQINYQIGDDIYEIKLRDRVVK